MKLNTTFSTQLILLVSTFVFIGCNSKNQQSNINSKENIVVIVKYKAQPTKENDAITELTKLLEKVKQEPHFINVKLHIDPKDKTNILLYEVWDDEFYFNTEHMKTDHLQKFIADSKNFLLGPPEISFWNEKNDFRK